MDKTDTLVMLMGYIILGKWALKIVLGAHRGNCIDIMVVCVNMVSQPSVQIYLYYVVIFTIKLTINYIRLNG